MGGSADTLSTGTRTDRDFGAGAGATHTFAAPGPASAISERGANWVKNLLEYEPGISLVAVQPLSRLRSLEAAARLRRISLLRHGAIRASLSG